MGLSVHLHEQINGLVLVVGLGLIGSSVSRQCDLWFKSVEVDISERRFDWKDATALVALIRQKIRTIKPSRVDIIWCAGKSGFNSYEHECNQELLFFQTFFRDIADQNDVLLSVSLVSSAGGIYEAMGHVSDVKSVKPCRPYSRLKLDQERILQNSAISNKIYRASSVYGFNEGSRVGLIPALIQSAWMSTPVEIYARQDTIRDYIYVEDLASKIVLDIRDNTFFGVCIAATGRATSIATLINLIASISNNRSPRVVYVQSESNAADISFSSRLIRAGFGSISLEEGILATAVKVRLNH